MPFPFEDLEVYQKSRSFIKRVESLSRDLRGKVAYAFIDQLTRAALSIPLNIAEGNGRWHKGDKKQFFWIARGSAFECVPLIQILAENKLIDNNLYRSLYGDLESIAMMLTKLVKSIEGLKR